MLDMGFIHDVDKIAARMPKNLQMLVFCNNSSKLKPFLKKYMENPEHIHINPKQVAAGNIEHYLVPSKHRNKIDLVHKMLLQFKPYLAVVFTNTKRWQTKLLMD